MTHPQDTTPANPAQVTEPMTDAEVHQWIDACNHEPARQVLRDYLAFRSAAERDRWAETVDKSLDFSHPVWGFNARPKAAIGAGGQAVAVKPLDLSNLLRHAYTAGFLIAGGTHEAAALYWPDYDPGECTAFERILSAIAHPVQPGWRDMESAPKDGTVINVVARYPDATSGFPRYAAYRTDYDAWVEYSRFEPQVIIPWAWRPRDEWPAEPRRALADGGRDAG